jgi:predicted nucleic acid-binding Zn ribbon protein
MLSERRRRRAVLVLAILVVGSLIIALVSLAIGPY